VKLIAERSLAKPSDTAGSDHFVVGLDHQLITDMLRDLAAQAERGKIAFHEASLSQSAKTGEFVMLSLELKFSEAGE